MLVHEQSVACFRQKPFGLFLRNLRFYYGKFNFCRPTVEKTMEIIHRDMYVVFSFNVLYNIPLVVCVKHTLVRIQTDNVNSGKKTTNQFNVLM